MHQRLITLILLILSTAAAAQTPSTQPAKTQADLEADLASLLSGATLEGSFTSSSADPSRLSTDQYTLGTVRKLMGKTWLIQAKIGYGGSEVMIPLPLPIEWAGDTPVIVVDNMTIPGMGTYSARVMFFDGHYSGYWKHGARGGNMFGIIRKSPTTAPTTRETPPR